MISLEITGATPGSMTGVCYDSRQVKRGSVFVAIKGNNLDGHDYIGEAVRRGATTIIAERRLDMKLPGKVTLVIVPDSRAALAKTADYFYDSPSEKLRVIGITGTNGKTTVSYLLKSVMDTAGKACGKIGTTGYDLLDENEEAPTTTPESVDLQRMMRKLVDKGAEYLTLEVSSHALAQNRVAEVRFRAAVYTNLTQDHLDYHHSMEEYFATKARLFTDYTPETAVVNMDDSYATRLVAMTGSNIITYGLDAEADITASDVKMNVGGLSMTLVTPDGSVPVRSGLTGRHNVYNILAAAGVAYSEGVPLQTLARGVASLKAVPGRLERVDAGQPFTIVVDYAHTDDALINVINALRGISNGKVITVFGCGGDRDRAKRPLMGKAAWSMSDKIVVTSDNPRTENPENIIEDILEGINRDDNPEGEMKVIPDRHEAIRAAMRMAAPDDVVLIAGKGHETYQIIGAIKHHFDDREEAVAAVREIYG